MSYRKVQTQSEYYTKEGVNHRRTHAVSPLMRYMALAMTQTAGHRPFGSSFKGHKPMEVCWK